MKARALICIILFLFASSVSFGQAVSRDEARQRAQSIVGKPKYHRAVIATYKSAAASSGKPSWFKTVYEVITNAIKKMLEALENILRKIPARESAAAPNVEFGKIFAIALGAAILIAALTLLILRLRKISFARGTRRNRRRPVPDTHYRYWYDEADTLAAQGDYNRALSSLIRSIILFLSIKEVIHSHDGDTNREVASLIRDAAVGKRYAPIVQAGEAAVFGGKACTQKEFARCKTLAEEIIYGGRE